MTRKEKLKSFVICLLIAIDMGFLHKKSAYDEVQKNEYTKRQWEIKQRIYQDMQDYQNKKMLINSTTP